MFIKHNLEIHKSIFHRFSEEYCGTAVLLSDREAIASNDCNKGVSNIIIKAGKHNINVSEDTEKRFA